MVHQSIYRFSAALSADLGAPQMAHLVAMPQIKQARGAFEGP